MWHPFHIMPPENLVVADALRSATAAPSCRLVYGERILARFPTKDKIGTDKQWRPAIDQLPGVTLTRRAPAGDRWELDVEQRWQFASTDHLLTATVTAASSDWRTPLRWTLRQALTPNKGAPPLTPLEEAGAWENGQVRRTCKVGRGSESGSHAAPSLTSIYTLMANFPTEMAARGGQIEGLLGEGFTFSPSAKLGPGHPAPRALPVAGKLQNYLLTFPGGLPFEFWVNDAGLVVFLCQGPMRVLVLEKVEAMG
jgi:hypothetical protein